MGIIYKLLSNKLKKQNKVLLFIIIVQTVSTVISAAIPYLSGNFVDVLILGTTVKSILEYALIIASIGIFSCAFSYVYTLKKVRVKNNISFELNKEIIQHLHKIPLEHRYEPIYMSQRINSDSTIIVSFFFDRVLTVCINTVQLVFLLSIFWILNKSIFFLVLLFCFIYIAIYQVLKRPLYNSNLMYKEEQSVFFNKLSEQLYLLEEIKVHSDFKLYHDALDKNYEGFFKCIYRFCRITTIFSVYDQIVCLFFQVATLIIGGIQVINGQMTIGEYSIVNVYFSSLLFLIKYYFSIGKEYQDVKSSIDRINNILSIKVEENNNKCVEQIENIKFSNLSIKKLFNKSGEFNKGKIYVVIGKNGSGKTTFLKGIIGITKDLTGKIFYSGHDINMLDLYKLRKKHISVMLQNEKVPYMTVEEYLCFSLQINTFDKVVGKMKNCGILDILLKKEFDVISIKSKQIKDISDGEKQLVLIIKTILKDADVYIFDEPTSSLNKEILIGILEILEAMKKNKIIILVSHDSTIIERADIVLNISHSNFAHKF